MEKRMPVVVIRQIGETDTILRALQEYGIRCAEITFRTPCAEEALIYACKNYPQMLIGAGTIINGDQCRRALAAGAKFYCIARVFGRGGGRLQGAKRRVLSRRVTPTEIMRALERGITTVKFFPAEVYGGLKRDEGAQRALSAGQVIPTGGVNAENMIRISIGV